MSILGIHHITAICHDPQANVDFYTSVLGLRLVKATINYDDPSAWHLYYADSTGQPGSILTFFPYPPVGKTGAGHVSVVSYGIPTGSSPEWKSKLNDKGIGFNEIENGLSLLDPDGMELHLIENRDATGTDIQGFAAPTLSVANPGPSLRLLADTLGFQTVEETDDFVKLAVADRLPNQTIIVRQSNERAMPGAGTVHHIAWRVADDPAQHEWLDKLSQEGQHVTPVQDRSYFHSIYFREPGHILYEIATDGPGWAVDEAPESLGSKLALPQWLEPKRQAIAQSLKPITTAAGVHLP